MLKMKFIILFEPEQKLLKDKTRYDNIKQLCENSEK